MATNYKGVGNTIQYANTGSAISSGAVVIVGDLVGIAETDIAATTGVGTVNIEGEYEVACNSADVISVGQVLDWDRKSLAFTNHDEATRTIVRRAYRKGFEPVVVSGS